MTKKSARIHNHEFSPVVRVQPQEKKAPVKAVALESSPEAVSHYVCDMLLELRRLSQREKLTFLTTVLEMAYHEAFMIANRIAPTPIEIEEVERITEMGRSWLKQSLERDA